MSAALALAGFAGLCLLSYAVDIGFAAKAALWFGSLHRPALSPANALMRPYAGLCYILLGAAAWRVWTGIGPGAALRLWGWQLLLNAVWAPALFGLQSPAAGLILIVPSLFAALATLRQFAATDGKAAIMMVPYVVWIVYCTGVTAGYWWLNAR